MQTKQTPQEIMKILADVETSFLPAVLKLTNQNSTPDVLAKVESDVTMFRAHMQRHYTDRYGITDWSFDNCRAAVIALKRLLSWEVPYKQRQSERDAANEAARANHSGDPTGLAKTFEDAAKAASNTVDKQTLKDCRVIAESASSTSHSATAQLRAQLSARFDELLRANTPPAQILTALKSLRDNFSWKPKFRR